MGRSVTSKALGVYMPASSRVLSVLYHLDFFPGGRDVEQTRWYGCGGEAGGGSRTIVRGARPNFVAREPCREPLHAFAQAAGISLRVVNAVCTGRRGSCPLPDQ